MIQTILSAGLRPSRRKGRHYPPVGEKLRTDLEIGVGEYSYLPIERVHFGRDSIRKLREELDRLRSERPFIVTGQTIAHQTSLVDHVEQASGRKVVGVFARIRQHTPESDITRAADEARLAKADSLISLGGGSPIDATKIMVKELSGNFRETHLPHIAIPTTLSAAEFSHSAGVTDERLNRKTGFRDLRMVPRLVFLDPSLTVPTPSWLWASTGIRSLDHAVESILSDKHQPYVDSLSLEAIRLLFLNLKRSTNDSTDMKSREACQIAGWMSYSGALSVGTGVSHAIGRVIGATWHIPHGITSCLTLAEVMRSTAEGHPERLSAIAAAEGNSTQHVSVEKAALLAADSVAKLVQELGLSKRLRDYKIDRTDLPIIAEQVGIGSKDFVLSILEKIW